MCILEARCSVGSKWRAGSIIERNFCTQTDTHIKRERGKKDWSIAESSSGPTDSSSVALTGRQRSQRIASQTHASIPPVPGMWCIKRSRWLHQSGHLTHIIISNTISAMRHCLVETCTMATVCLPGQTEFKSITFTQQPPPPPFPLLKN